MGLCHPVALWYRYDATVSFWRRTNPSINQKRKEKRRPCRKNKWKHMMTFFCVRTQFFCCWRGTYRWAATIGRAAIKTMLTWRVFVTHESSAGEQWLISKEPWLVWKSWCYKNPPRQILPKFGENFSLDKSMPKVDVTSFHEFEPKRKERERERKSAIQSGEDV